jgi:hypothetical protein
VSESTETAALDVAAYRAAFGTLRQLVAEHMADALLSGDEAEHRRTTRLARRLDEQGLSLDDLINGYVEHTWESRIEWAWKSPAARKELTSFDSPWDDTPPF